MTWNDLPEGVRPLHEEVQDLITCAREAVQGINFDIRDMKMPYKTATAIHDRVERVLLFLDDARSRLGQYGGGQ